MVDVKATSAVGAHRKSKDTPGIITKKAQKGRERERARARERTH